MMVGMPGTGMGGLLYLCMAAWMPVHELWRLARGRSGAGRWVFIARNWLVIGGSLACLWVAMLSCEALLAVAATRNPRGGLGEGHLATALGGETGGVLASAAWASGIALALVVVLVHVLRFTLSRGELRSQGSPCNLTRASRCPASSAAGTRRTTAP